MRTTWPIRTLSYRGYLLNSDNSFREAQEFHCLDDDEAKQRAMAWLDLAAKAGAAGLELWQRDRRVFARWRGKVGARASTD
jgi:hypothetical protein